MENTRLNNKNLFTAFIALLILNAMCLIAITKKTGVHNLDGSYSEANSTELIRTAFLGLLVSFPLLCAIIAAIIAIFINRKEAYKKRFIRVFLFTLVIIYAITFGVYLKSLFL